MKKSKRNILRLTGGIIAIFFLGWLVTSLLVNHYKGVIHEKAITEIRHRIEGEVTLGSISPEFFSTFPRLSVCLSDLRITDSLWDQHHHDLVKAEKIYLSFSWLSLLRGKPKVAKVIIQNGNIHLYTDPCGYRNLIRKNHIRSTGHHHTIPQFTLRHTRLILQNDMMNSLHDIDATYLNAQVSNADSVLTIHLSIRSLVHGIGFNLEKGSYLSEKSLNGNFYFTYIPDKRITFNHIALAIANQDFNVDGDIFLHTDTMTYDLLFRTQDIKYQQAIALLTQSLRKNLSPVDILQPFDAEAAVAGQMAQKVIPRITTRFHVKETSMETPIGALQKCSFSGSFLNQVDSISGPGDANSKFTFNNVRADWNHITLTADQIEITNLHKPFLVCDLQSTVDLKVLNTLGESATIQFLRGTGKLNVNYRGSLSSQDTIKPVLNGTFSLKDAEVHYLPRDLHFKNCNGELVFAGQELKVKNIMASVGQSVFTITGNIQHLVSMINKNPEQLTMDLVITTPALNLGDFISYVRTSAPAVSKTSVKKNKINQVAENTDRMLRNGTAKLTLRAGEVLYKKFKATQVKASLWLETNKITLNNVSLRHAGGTATLHGSLINGAGTNSLKLASEVDAMDIPLLFKAFDNFGQDAVTAANTKGLLSARMVISGELTDKAIVKENSMNGTIDFSVVKGELNHFEPLMKITEVAFKKRDFSQIQFAELRNRLVIAGSAFQIQKMEIRSNVVILFVEGVYDPKHGTDMSIQVPLSNLSRAEHDILENKGKAGMNIRLRAKTGEDGKLNVTWDPLNKAGKERKAAIRN